MRSFFLKLHYYLAFIFMLPLIIGGATGIFIAFDHALDEQMNPQMMLHGGAPLADRSAIDFDKAILAVQPLLQTGDTIKSVMIPRTEDSNILVSFSGAHGDNEAYVNPHTHALAGTRPRDGHFMRTVYKLHATLLLRPVGDYVLLLGAIALLLLSIGGIVNWLWHPSRKLQLRVKRKMFLRWWDIHRLLGVVAAALMLLIALSGGTMAYMHSLGRILTPHQKPELPVIAAVEGAPITAAQAVQSATPVFAGAVVTHLAPPAEAGKPWQVWLRQPDEPRTSKGMSKVMLHPVTAEVLETEDALARTGWSKWLLWAFPLHNGEWAGLPMRILHSVMGFVLLVLGYTGTRSFLARRKPKPKARQRAAAGKAGHPAA